MGLEIYQQKRDFSQTPEPKGKISRAHKHRFVCQEHHASSLHFDFRLEIGGVLKSWSIRKGPSLNPKIRRLAIPTEDHPVEYLKFEGDIPAGNYGAGKHRIWDSGSFRLLEGEDAAEQFEKGKLKFELNGDKLKGAFSFFRLGKRDRWLLVKANDEFADENWKLELLIPDEDGGNFIQEAADAKKRRRSARKPKAGGEVVKTAARLRKGEKPPSVDEALSEKDLKGERRVKVGDYIVDLTSLERVYWKDKGFTKADLVRYYHEISDYILPYLKDRPLIMKRYPNGVDGQSFHQHDVDEVPEYVRTVSLEAEDGGVHTVDYIVCDNLPTNLYLANLGAIERHPWHARTGDLESPDWFVFDLDPGTRVELETICEVAVAIRKVIETFELASYVKTSGSRGLHVYVPVEPVYNFDRITGFAERIAGQVARENPKIATVERSKSKRTETQVYLDYLQNAYGKSVVAPYSVRPKSGATVSAPIEWEEVEKMSFSLQDFTIETMPERLKRKGDLFKPILFNKQKLDKVFKSK